MSVSSVDSSKPGSQQIGRMFDEISPRYDFLNHLLSFGVDRYWRKKVVKLLKKEKPKSILDVATGTGDLAIALTKTGASYITGIDISEGMLKVGIEKIKKLGLQNRILLRPGNAEALDQPDHTFSAVTVAFGVRNFTHLEKGLSELYRVLIDGGTLVILEFSKPRKAPFKQLYNFYFRYILPVIGRLISRHSNAYTYLPDSVSKFPSGEEFTRILTEIGFKEVKWLPLTFGIASIYVGRK